MEPIKLTDTGEMLIIPEESGLTEESPLSVDGELGCHKWGECNGMIHCSATATGWTVICDCCGWHNDDVPKEVKTCGDLRRFFAEEHAKKHAKK